MNTIQYIYIHIMKIYTIGDSHCLSYMKSQYVTKVHWIGPVTMHRVGRDIINFQNFGCDPIGAGYHIVSVPTDGIVIASFGEVDIRNHIINQISLNTTEDDVINILITNFINALILNKQNYKYIAVPSIVPTTRQSDSNYVPENITDIDRIRYTKKINKILSNELSKHNMYFLNLYDHYVDNEGFLKAELRDDSIHIIHTNYMDTKLLEMIEYFNYGFMIASCIRNQLHFNTLIRCINSIKQFHDNKQIIIIVDFTSDDTYIQQLKDINYTNINIINNTEHVPADMIMYDIYLKYHFFDYVITLQDSMWLNNKFENIDTIQDIEYLWHFTNHRIEWSKIIEPQDTFAIENNIITHDDLILFCINKYAHNEFQQYALNLLYDKNKWAGCFGTLAIMKWDFLRLLQDKTSYLNIAKEMNNNRRRRAIESIFALACQYTLNKEIQSSLDGNHWDGINKSNNYKSYHISKELFDRQ